MSRKPSNGMPIVYRIRVAGLREKLEAYIASERRRTGWEIQAHDVVDRALAEFLERNHKP